MKRTRNRSFALKLILKLARVHSKSSETCHEVADSPEAFDEVGERVGDLRCRRDDGGFGRRRLLKKGNIRALYGGPSMNEIYEKAKVPFMGE